jgi:hypothetical protein
MRNAMELTARLVLPAELAKTAVFKNKEDFSLKILPGLFTPGEDLLFFHLRVQFI